MASTLREFRRIAPVALLAFLACAWVMQAAAQNPGHLRKKDLKTLSASTAGHAQLAIYYREKAQHLRVKAQEFSVQADYLATQPATIESKQGISCNCTSHYRYFSKIYAQEAKDAETLAAHYEQLTQEDKSKSIDQ